MTETAHVIPAALQQIIEDFQWAEGQEKLQLLLELSDKLPPLPGWLQDMRNEMDQVHECMTPVFIYAKVENGGMHFYFDIPPESPTVRGYAAILGQGLDGATPQQVLAIPADFYQEMGLDKVLSYQRLNGIMAILAHLKRLATQHLNG